MLKIHTLTLGLFQVNCYIVHKENATSCVVIDPGYDEKKILRHLQDEGLQAEAILLTHGHFDHVGAMKALAMELDCPVYIRPEEHTMPQTLTAGPLGDTVAYPDRFSVAGMDISVLHTPGHTPGAVCLLMEDAIFSGDTLFAGAIGRTDHPGGDYDLLMKSIFEKLMCLDGDIAVIPGHGPDTSIADERMTNPFLLPFNEPYES